MDALALAVAALILAAAYAGHVKLATLIMRRVRLGWLEAFKLEGVKFSV